MFDLEFLKGLPAQVRLTNGSVAGDGLELERAWNGDSMRATLTNVSPEPVHVREVALMFGRFPVAASCPFYAEGFHMLSQHGGTLGEPHNIGKYGTDEAFFRLKKSPFSPDTYTTYSMMLLISSAVLEEITFLTSLVSKVFTVSPSESRSSLTTLGCISTPSFPIAQTAAAS